MNYEFDKFWILWENKIKTFRFGKINKYKNQTLRSLTISLLFYKLSY